MNKKIKTEYEKKINLINKYNEYYYNKSNSLVSLRNFFIILSGAEGI